MPVLSAPPRTNRVIGSVRTADLNAGPGLEPDGPDRWVISASHVRLSDETRLEPGWYAVRLTVRSADRFAIRKRLEVTFDSGDADPRPVGREAFTWNRSLGESFLLRLTRPASGVRVDLWHAEGLLSLEQFEVRRLANAAALAHALKAKFQLTRTFGCLGPAVVRGGKLLLLGRLREFGTKLYKGLTDARAMQLDAIEVGDLDGGWSRTRTLPADEADRIRAAVDALPDPLPVAVVLKCSPLAPRADMRSRIGSRAFKVGPLAERADYSLTQAAARRSAHSVRRQLYPHWRLFVPAELQASLGDDSRVVEPSEPIECKHLLTLPAGVELTEDALFHLVTEFLRDPDLESAIGSDRIVSLRRTGAPTGRLSVVDSILATSPEDRPSVPLAAGRLVLSADVRGIGGYDHVAFALLKGLPAAGVEVRMHPEATVRPELVPADVLRPAEPRRPNDPQLVVGPPFLVSRFGLDHATAVLTMWETDRLAAGWVRQLNRARVVIVPSRWQVEGFRASGVTAPIAVAPLGFDPLIYHRAGGGPTVCTFGTAGALDAGGLRKNVQLAIDLFRRAFPTEPDVRLRVKITPGSPGVETYDDPRIDVLRAGLPPGELAEWYRSLTAYANVSAGEGFGLHLIEAMACGRPLVSPVHGGPTAFFDDSVGYPVAFDLVPARNDIYAGHWAAIRDDSLIAQLRRVFSDRDEAKRLGVSAAQRAAAFTWAASAGAVAATLCEHGLLKGWT